MRPSLFVCIIHIIWRPLRVKKKVQNTDTAVGVPAALSATLRLLVHGAGSNSATRQRGRDSTPSARRVSSFPVPPCISGALPAVRSTHRRERRFRFLDVDCLKTKPQELVYRVAAVRIARGRCPRRVSEDTPASLYLADSNRRAFFSRYDLAPCRWPWSWLGPSL